MLRWCLPLLLALLPLSARAGNSAALGWGWLGDEDSIGDFHDRWHTGAFAFSEIFGPGWRGQLPAQPFRLMEFRLTGDAVAPASLALPAPNDRRYAGVLGFGLHSQFDWRGVETDIGGDLFLTGPQSGVSAFQDWLHHRLGVTGGEASYANQIGNAAWPTVSAEIGKSFALGQHRSLRPYATAMVGLESWVRLGGDYSFGHFGQGAVMVRDMTTGQRYRTVAGDRTTGFSFSLGGDVAHVFSSRLMPAGGNVVASNIRERLRAGVHWQGVNDAVFYGLTWLGPEYVGQPGGQLVGSLHFQLQF